MAALRLQLLRAAPVFAILDANVGASDDDQLGDVLELDVDVDTVEREGGKGERGPGSQREVPGQRDPEVSLLA